MEVVPIIVEEEEEEEEENKSRPRIYIRDALPPGRKLTDKNRDRYCKGDYSRMEIQPYDVNINDDEHTLYDIDIPYLEMHLPIIGDGLELRPSTIPEGGLGVFATKEFFKRQIVTFYWGQIVHYQDVCGKTSHARALFHMLYTIMGNRTPDGEIIDSDNAHAMMQGHGGGAFINDSRGSGNRHNVEFLSITTTPGQAKIFAMPYRNEPEKAFKERIKHLPKGERIIGIRALRNIQAGEELFIDYGRDYWATDKKEEPPTKSQKLSLPYCASCGEWTLMYYTLDAETNAKKFYCNETCHSDKQQQERECI